MGKKAKNASFISGTEATKISKEIQKVEKRRIVKSTLCNERSSRSHCMVCIYYFFCPLGIGVPIYPKSVKLEIEHVSDNSRCPHRGRTANAC